MEPPRGCLRLNYRLTLHGSDIDNDGDDNLQVDQLDVTVDRLVASLIDGRCREPPVAVSGRAYKLWLHGFMGPSVGRYAYQLNYIEPTMAVSGPVAPHLEVLGALVWRGSEGGVSAAQRSPPLQNVGGRGPLRKDQPGPNLLGRTGPGDGGIWNHKPQLAPLILTVDLRSSFNPKLILRVSLVLAETATGGSLHATAGSIGDDDVADSVDDGSDVSLDDADVASLDADLWPSQTLAASVDLTMNDFNYDPEMAHRPRLQGPTF
ncbi:hypothetical protein BDK51DRAFT_50942 [Blyttiomyces helicus]|uniref:Uncharacterized protein n=1 Tax=Blyttiomyces helicus TaxID=388810 RepID=A0A4P9WNJ0_9FUNG|nr:hypothetical protein BDK51DRAFT_50942 [Blyttiomyces helicus]|eukprot:RKO93653.1 hypothetical protein BDK51DRAFT_50942 [Blyttiomyces helicus]